MRVTAIRVLPLWCLRFKGFLEQTQNPVFLEHAYLFGLYIDQNISKSLEIGLVSIMTQYRMFSYEFGNFYKPLRQRLKAKHWLDSSTVFCRNILGKYSCFAWFVQTTQWLPFKLHRSVLWKYSKGSMILFWLWKP